MEIPFNIRFSSKVQEEFFNCTKRNICWNSGYGGGKTFALCLKSLILMLKFPGYRCALGRYKATELRRTTMQTFFKICPTTLYDEKYGGKRADSLGYVRLINGSLVYWMHFDEFDESALRSLEINLAGIDQAEEIPETVFLTLESRVGRWTGIHWDAVDDEVKRKLPVNEFTNLPEAPGYMILLCNPPDEGEFSWIIQRFHPESAEFKEKHYKDHAYFQSSSMENKALQKEVLNSMLNRSDEWVERFVHGKILKGAGAIHSIQPDSIIQDYDFINYVLRQSSLSRILDHGASSPTCCLWFASWKGFYFCYREYYQPDRTISYHRKEIVKLSENEYYILNLADPSIFKKTLEKYGGFWTVADEYADQRVDGPPLYWSPADNNEFATRNRINELLKIDPLLKNPITGQEGSPRLFFVKKSELWPNGCDHVIRQTSSQKKKLLDTINGQKIYSDEREESVADHAYDPLRYFCASHLSSPSEPKPKAPTGSFDDLRRRIKALKVSGYFDRYGMPQHG